MRDARIHPEPPAHQQIPAFVDISSRIAYMRAPGDTAFPRVDSDGGEKLLWMVVPRQRDPVGGISGRKMPFAVLPRAGDAVRFVAVQSAQPGCAACSGTVRAVHRKTHSATGYMILADYTET
jgi:hypothetical protein